MLEFKELIKLHNLHIHQVVIQSEAKYFVAGKVVRLGSLSVGGKTGPMAKVRDFVW